MPKKNVPGFVTSDNLSHAWGEMFLKLMATAGGKISPMLVSINGFDEKGDITEDDEIKNALSILLGTKEQTSIEDVAFTIFPKRLWELAKGDRQKLYELYKYSFVSYRRTPLNRRGLYFQRMIMTDADDNESHNQLEYIINRHLDRKAKNGGAPKMHLITSIHNPKQDHDRQSVPGFPCMQQVSFCPTPNGLIVNASYATQQAVRKAYGNFLGLARLAKFMAAEMQLNVAQLNIMIGEEKIGDNKFPKSSLRELESLVKQKVYDGTES